MKKLKVLASFGLACVTLTTFASCGNPNPGTSSSIDVNFVAPAEGFDTETPVSITFYHTMGQNLQEILDIYLEDFYLEYPNIEVLSHAIGGYDDVRDQMTTQLSAGSSNCDIAYCYPDHVALYDKAKSVIALDNLIDDPVYGFTAEQKADFTASYYEEGKCLGDGKTYTLPFSKSSEVLYYDKTFFEENDLSVPRTWDEMEAVCRQIKALDPNSTPLGYDSASNWFITMCEQLGSGYTSADKDNHYLFDNDTNKAFVKKFKRWYDDGLVTTKGLYGGYTSNLFTNVDGQRCYMCIGSSAGATYQTLMTSDGYAFETGVVSIPQATVEKYESGQGAVISQGPDLCIFNGDDPQKIMASWLLARFLTTNVGFQAQFSISSGYTPVIESCLEYDVYANHLATANTTNNIAALSTSVTIEQKDMYFTSPAFVGSSQARDQVGDLLEGVLSYSGSDLDKYIDDRFDSAVAACKQYK